MTRPTITYFSDVLCIWSYISQIRLDELASEYGDRIAIDEKFVSVFADARTKTHATWKDKGGYAAMNALFQKLSKKYPHISVHPDVWTVTQPTTSTVVHQVLKAVQAVEGADSQTAYADTIAAKAVRGFREAFFAQALDVSNWQVQADLIAELGLEPDAVETKLRSGEAAALLDADLKQVGELHVSGSPTFVMNDGRQTLFGNVGYKLIKANVEELFRTNSGDNASWC